MLAFLSLALTLLLVDIVHSAPSANRPGIDECMGMFLHSHLPIIDKPTHLPLLWAVPMVPSNRTWMLVRWSYPRGMNVGYNLQFPVTEEDIDANARRTDVHLYQLYSFVEIDVGCYPFDPFDISTGPRLSVTEGQNFDIHLK
ncbi:hypothetical protein B0H19DRAFT_1250647 [Mycena capillaripes]|nr:hypothetical protein B0H19DRAFT_1250647 [Mycena capillaripes]